MKKVLVGVGLVSLLLSGCVKESSTNDVKRQLEAMGGEVKGESVEVQDTSRIVPTGETVTLYEKIYGSGEEGKDVRVDVVVKGALRGAEAAEFVKGIGVGDIGVDEGYEFVVAEVAVRAYDSTDKDGAYHLQEQDFYFEGDTDGVISQYGLMTTRKGDTLKKGINNGESAEGYLISQVKETDKVTLNYVTYDNEETVHFLLDGEVTEG